MALGGYTPKQRLAQAAWPLLLSAPKNGGITPLRWRLIKSHFSRALPVNERRSQTRLRHGERGIWQRHYWEHLIRN